MRLLAGYCLVSGMLMQIAQAAPTELPQFITSAKPVIAKGMIFMPLTVAFNGQLKQEHGCVYLYAAKSVGSEKFLPIFPYTTQFRNNTIIISLPNHKVNYIQLDKEFLLGVGDHHTLTPAAQKRYGHCAKGVKQQFSVYGQSGNPIMPRPNMDSSPGTRQLMQ